MIKQIHQHVIFIERIAQSLSGILEDALLIDAFRNKEEELSLVFRLNDSCFSIVLNTACRQGLFLFYDHEISRHSGVQPVFEELKYQRISKLKTIPNERSFEVYFDTERFLFFKCYGPLSNVIFFENRKVKELYRASVLSDMDLTPDMPIRPVSEKLQAEYAYASELKSYYILKHLDEYIIQLEKPIQDEQVYFTYDILDASSYFAQRYIQQYHFIKEKNAVLKSVNDQIKKQEKFILNNKKRLHYLETAVNPEEIGHLIMANLHLIDKGAEKAEVYDFYRDNQLEIKLKKDLSPQDNAAQYYRKAKNRKLEIQHANQLIYQAEEKLKKLNPALNEIVNAVNKKQLKQNNKVEIEQKNASGFKEFECDGFRIYVGRNSENNDQLTLKFAKKDDLWLHAKGVSGSHVIIRNQQNRKTPEHVIQRAAELAAYFSKSKSSGLVAVMLTEKKYVRKPKGALAGQVRVDREETILAEPKL